MFEIFDFIARPFGQFLMFLYDFSGNYGLALLLFAASIRVILLPFQMKSKRGMMRQARLQPKLQEIQKKYASNKAKINEEMQKMYKEEGVNPASGCLWGFLPLPIMLALFQAIRRPLTMMMGVREELLEACVEIYANGVYICEVAGGAIAHRLHETGFTQQLAQGFGGGGLYLEMEQATWISRHWDQFSDFVGYGLQQISFYLGPMNLGHQPLWDFFWHESTDWSHVDGWLPGLLLFFIPLVSGGAQFVSAAITRKVSPQPQVQEGAGKSMQTMMMLMPLMSVYFGFILPAALGFYWTIGTILQIGQDLWLNKKYTKILDAEDAERNRLRAIKEAEIEAKRLETERKKAEGIVEKNPNKSKRKQQINEKQERLEKTAEWEKKHTPPSDAEEVLEPSREGKRRYARGRAYDPERYPEVEGAVGDASDIDDPDLDDDAENLDVDADNAESPDMSSEENDINEDDDRK
ncbi:MAG: membrane protein insertase YidC [Oscillospiraceae bacterium]|nr:membrane protein insertase YidC [Oscillospiraceae bacterium]